MAVVGRYPVECALHLAVGALKAALAERVVLGLNLHDVALGILCAASALHDVGVLQTYLLARSHAEEFFRSILHEVVALDPKIAREGDGVCAVSLVLRVVNSLHLLSLTLRIVGDDEFNRVEHSRHAQRTLVQILANGSLEQRHVVESVELGVAD